MEWGRSCAMVGVKVVTIEVGAELSSWSWLAAAAMAAKDLQRDCGEREKKEIERVTDQGVFLVLSMEEVIGVLVMEDVTGPTHNGEIDSYAVEKSWLCEG
ncbi:hypothetical protein TIFTF001_005274 [Ficus carica]|uniref:Uncharacterized protein n=1 Tax=Ficus carica TaxID=3494 RepID=A0AA88CYE3_FICCA|nr:hypothetical protein TIFTF001_005274 [Ficus carica]